MHNSKAIKLCNSDKKGREIEHHALSVPYQYPISVMHYWHRRLWTFLAEHPMLEKRDFFLLHPEIPQIEQDCFACEASKDCNSCFLDWGKSKRSCKSPFNPFKKWLQEKDPMLRSYYADQIANLPLSEHGKAAMLKEQEKGI